jgi:lactobin A/cerein 7B family class IIb bacteriocin
MNLDFSKNFSPLSSEEMMNTDGGVVIAWAIAGVIGVATVATGIALADVWIEGARWQRNLLDAQRRLAEVQAGI